MRFCQLFVFTACLCVLLQSKTTSPPRGWNSWISYKFCINESEFVENVDVFVDKLKPFGYEYVVIDAGWTQDPNSSVTNYVDEWGRPQPSPIKYPHSPNGTGFTWLSNQVHSKGIKFGLWVGKGIHQLALDLNTPVLGTSNPIIYAKDIVNMSHQCGTKDFYGLNMTQDGSQQFADSLYQQFAEWGVDFIKNDCSFAQQFSPSDIDFVFNAMDNVYNTMGGYEFVYSLSPGNTEMPPWYYPNTTHWTSNSNMYRIVNDCWDEWDKKILPHFNISAEWAQNGFIASQGRNGYSFPDSDMLPVGYINSGAGGGGDGSCGPYHYTNLTHSQQRVLFTLSSVTRSPLIFGGSVKKLQYETVEDAFTLALITNQIALSVNYESLRNRQISATYDSNDYPMEVIWSADGMSNDFYVALFNTNVKSKDTVQMVVSFQVIGGDLANYEQCQYTEAWTGQTGIMIHSTIQYMVASNDTALLYLTQCS